MTIIYSNIPGAVALFFLLSLIYDRVIVERLETNDPPLGVTAWEVAGGVGYTVFVAAMVVGLEIAMLMLLFFVASGIPMIMGSYSRHAARAG